MGLFGRRCGGSGGIVRQARGCEIVMPPGDLVLVESNTPDRTGLDTANCPIFPWPPESGTVRPEIQTMLREIQAGAMRPGGHGFFTACADLNARSDLSRAEFFQSVTLLSAAIQQARPELANRARETLISLFQNNPQLHADQILVAGQLYHHLDASNPANTALRQSLINLQGGLTAHREGVPVDFSSINTPEQFCAATEGLRSAFHHASPTMQNHIRDTMARLFREARPPEGANVETRAAFDTFRSACAAVILNDPSNCRMIGGTSEREPREPRTEWQQRLFDALIPPAPPRRPL